MVRIIHREFSIYSKPKVPYTQVREMAGSNEVKWDDPTYAHLRSLEGFQTVGHTPYDTAGVFIATAVNLGKFSEDDLIRLKVPEPVIDKLRIYLGLRTKAEVIERKLTPHKLRLSREEASQLDWQIIKQGKEAVKQYTSNMTELGVACLVSLNHWSMRLDSKSPDGKLAVRLVLPDGSKTMNYVWDAINEKTATDHELGAALEQTLAFHSTGTSAHTRISHELSLVEGKEI